MHLRFACRPVALARSGRGGGDVSDWNEKHETKRADELQAFFDQLASLLSMPADASPEAVVSEVSRIMSVYRRFTDSNIYAWQARAAKVLRGLEWSSFKWLEVPGGTLSVLCCPCCQGVSTITVVTVPASVKRGHEMTCDLAALLAELPTQSGS